MSIRTSIFLLGFLISCDSKDGKPLASSFDDSGFDGSELSIWAIQVLLVNMLLPILVGILGSFS